MFWNARSLNNKCDDIMVMLQDIKVDIALISETWLVDVANSTSATVKSYGYSIFHTFRDDIRGGGTAIIYKPTIGVCSVNLDVNNIVTFNYAAVLLKLNVNIKVLVVCLYRTGPVSKLFFEELDMLLQAAFLCSANILLGGDFNIHFEKQQNHITQKLMDTLLPYNMEQLIVGSTHNQLGTIDLLLDNSKLIDTSTIQILDKCDLSDHYPILCCSRSLETTSKTLKHIYYRDLKTADHNQISSDFADAVCENVLLSSDFYTSVYTFFNTITGILDQHAPVVHKTITVVPTAPWFDREYKDQRKLRRKLEKKWLKTKDENDHELFLQVRAQTTKMAKLKKKNYYNNQLNKTNNIKEVYQILNRELDNEKGIPILPETEDITVLAKEFNDFFIKKIEKIRSNLSISSLDEYTYYSSANALNSFRPTTIKEIKDIINESGIKCSPSDFLPTPVLKENMSIFLPTLCELVNLSLYTGSMDGLKIADVIPNIKDDKLDPNNKQNYRPISNLTFLGKLVERVVLKRLNEHLESNNLITPEQSAYKKNHSTETILVKIVNDILVATDKNSATVLMLLDLSAAFDTVDHNKLLNILEQEIGITGIALKWFRSFLSGRSQRIRLGGTVSEEIILLFGVPQGSVLGPVLFNLYIRSLYNMIKKCGFNVQGYADDHQVYKSFPPKKQAIILVAELKECFQNIQKWMSNYYLQLNPGKTQIMVLGTSRILKLIEIHGIHLTENICIRFVSTTKNLGVMLDNRLSFKPHIMNLKKHSFKLLRNIRKARQYFSQDQIKVIVNSLVVCKLDYCNALYCGISKAELKQLQIIQNAAAKTILGLYKYDHMENSLKDLHWLPIEQRIKFKILLLVYKTLNNMGPAYLEEMLNYSSTSLSVQLIEPRMSSMYGYKSFSRTAPHLWNKLPTELKTSSSLLQFKAKLKTHLFIESLKNEGTF